MLGRFFLDGDMEIKKQLMLNDVICYIDFKC